MPLWPAGASHRRRIGTPAPAHGERGAGLNLRVSDPPAVERARRGEADRARTFNTRLRRKLDDDSARPRWILNDLCGGYRVPKPRRSCPRECPVPAVGGGRSLPFGPRQRGRRAQSTLRPSVILQTPTVMQRATRWVTATPGTVSSPHDCGKALGQWEALLEEVQRWLMKEHGTQRWWT